MFTPLNASLTEKVSGFTESTYSAVTGLAYDATNKKLGLKVGADTVIPFNGGFVRSILKVYLPNSGSAYVEYVDSSGTRYSSSGTSSAMYTYINDNIPEFTNVQWVYQQGVRFEVVKAGYYTQSKDTAPVYYNVGDTFLESYNSYNDIIYYGQTNPFN